MKLWFKILTSFMLAWLATFPHSVFSQNRAEIRWQKTIGGSNDDQCTSIQVTQDGGYILAVWSSSNISGDKTENSKGGSDYWVIKIDTMGSIQWQKTIGGNLFDYPADIQQTKDGGFILGGSSRSDSSGDKTGRNWDTNLFTTDFWIVKMDSSGNIEWQNTIGGSGYDWLTSIEQTTDHGYILGGHSESNISGNKTENCIGQTDFWIVKVDSMGTIQWQNTIGGNWYEDNVSVIQTKDRGYLIGGNSSSGISGDKTENKIGAADYWIVKTDSSGTILWQNTIGGDDFDFMSTVHQTLDGGYILGGYSSSGISGDKTELCNGYDDYWIVKTDSSGLVQWQHTYGGSQVDILGHISQTMDGGYFLSGRSRSEMSASKRENNIGGWDYWIIKTDTSGAILWQNTLGGNDEDMTLSAKEISAGEYIVSGSSLSNISCDKTENSMGGLDCWIIRITDDCNSITGKLFIDANSNGMQDSLEVSLPNKLVSETNTSRLCFSDPNGFYIVSVPDTGSYLVTPSFQNYFTAVPANHTAYFPAINLTDSLNDFAYQPLGIFDDLCLTLTPLGLFRAGREASYMINYENVGNTTLNGTVIFYPDNHLTFVSSTPSATSVNSGSVVWNIGTLTPFQSGSILVSVRIIATTQTGTLIQSNARIEPIAGDANPYCNNGTWGILVTGSFDPNEILVDRNSVFTTELSNPPYLEYIINFQNTGNDSALDVKVLNPIDTSKLQINTLEFVASSHPVNMSYKPWERNMEFSFNNIYLPDINVNDPASHGFVRYRVKPKSSLLAGDSILNTAYIYFDFNQPVQTNTAITQIILPTSLDEFTVYGLQFTVFPNPLTSQATISFDNPKHESFELSVSDVTGRLIESVTTTTGEVILEKGSKTAGLYLLTLTRNKTGERANAKIVIGD